MAEQPKPKKQSRKGKKITLNPSKHWKDIINGVDKKEVPINILQQIIVRLIDGTETSINIKKLLEEGINPDDIEQMLDIKFDELDAYIENVDFFVDVDKVVNVVQPETDKVLKNL